MSEVIYWTVLVLITIPIGFVIGWAVFESWDGFWECFKYALKPDIISWFQGEGLDDFFAEMRFAIWLIMCVGVTFGLHWIAQTYLFNDDAAAQELTALVVSYL